MSADRIEHARRLLAEAGDLLTADPAKLYWVAKQVQPLLDLLDADRPRAVEAGDPAVAPPAGVLGLGHSRGGRWITVPTKPCGCGVLLGEACDCGAFAASAYDAFASPLKVGWTQ